jgi:hypothetical protein
VAFVVQQAVVSFVTCHWDPGTRPWDSDFSRSVFDSRATRWQKLESQGASKIGAFLEEHPGVERVVGFGPEENLQWLPARFESLRIMRFFKPNPLDRPAAFLRYLHDYQIDFAIMPRISLSGVAAEAISFLEQQPETVVMEDQLYRLIDLRQLRSRLPELAENLQPAEPRKVHYRFPQQLEKAKLSGQGPLTAPWRQRIATANTSIMRYTGRAGLVMVAGTAAEYTLKLPNQENLAFVTQVGFYPPFILRNESDGSWIEVTVTPADGDGTALRASHHLLPAEAFVPLDIPLEDLRGQRVRVRLAVSNLPKHHNLQDWIIWVLPRVEYSKATGASRNQSLKTTGAPPLSQRPARPDD